MFLELKKKKKNESIKDKICHLPEAFHCRKEETQWEMRKPMPEGISERVAEK